MTESAPPVQPSYDRPLAGLRVLDLSQGIAGPYCAMLLAQYGCSVVKVEPAAGDWGRGLGKRIGDHTPIALSANRGKRSIVLDLKTDAGRQLLARLAARADVLIENFRPGVCARLGVGYEAVKAANPRILYVSISAFGQTGPRATQPGSDTIGQAFAGMMWANRDATGHPRPTTYYATDYVTALYAFQATAMALAARPFEKEGRHLDISLIHSSAAFLTQKLIESRLEGPSPQRVNTPAGTYRTQDGWIAVTLTREPHFAAFCRVLGREDLLADARFASFALRGEHRELLVPVVEQALLTRSTADWLQAFSAADVLCSLVQSVGEFIDDEHVRALNLVLEQTLPGLPPIPWVRIPGALQPQGDDARNHWPNIGGDTRQVLRDELGMSDDEMAVCAASGAVRL